MPPALRKSGIAVLGNTPWGTHFCQFYETKQDLLELLVPYFKAGLENNEYCLWIIADPMTTDDAVNALHEAIPDFQQYIEKKSIEILTHIDWYIPAGKFDAKQASNAWIQKLDEALARGYDGMRINGNETWLKRNGWDNFMEYEEGLNKILKNRPVIGLCTYPLTHTNAGMVLDVGHAHETVIAKRKGQWMILEQPDIKQLKAELLQRGDELEQRVTERTKELEKLVEQLRWEINERQNAEKRIKREIDLQNEIIDTIPMMTWSFLPNGRLEFVNKVWMTYTGLSLAEAIEDPVAVIHPDDFPGAMEKWKVSRAAMAFHEDEMRLRGADGKYRWFLVRTEPLLDKNGEVYKWYGVSIDIEDRKQAEEMLRQNENLLVQAEQIAHIGSWSLDLRSNTVMWSDELYRMFGISKSDFDHSLESVIDSVHPDDRGHVRHIVEEAIKTSKPYDFYFRRIKPDGQVRIVHARGAVITDEHGNAVKMYGASQDVTEIKQAEHDLQMAYQRLSYHVENTPLAVIEWDKDLNITRWSGQAEKIFGWKAAEVLGRNRYDADFPIVYIEDEKQVEKVDYELIKGLVNRNLSLNRNYTKDGNVIYCEWYNSVLRDDQGKVITILSLIHDVTERKMAEEKLSQSYEQIRSLSGHLRTIREEERKYIAREIHDELGQYLTVLKMDVSALCKKLNVTDPAVDKKLRGLSDLIDKIVYSVRRIALELRPGMLDDLGLEAAIAWHLEEFEKQSGIKTFFTEPEEEWELSEPVKTHLFRIFQESLTNVVRHSKASEVRVGLMKKNDQLLLTITDNGIGFNPENVQKVNTLGILGMKERTAIIGGTYEIQSKPGEGTSIILAVPLTGINK